MTAVSQLLRAKLIPGRATILSRTDLTEGLVEIRCIAPSPLRPGDVLAVRVVGTGPGDPHHSAACDRRARPHGARQAHRARRRLAPEPHPDPHLLETWPSRPGDGRRQRGGGLRGAASIPSSEVATVSGSVRACSALSLRFACDDRILRVATHRPRRGSA